MATILCSLLLIAIVQGGFAGRDRTLDGTELALGFLIHRHGDRTPVSSNLGIVPEESVETLEELIAPWGYGQLTNVGRRTAYQLGKYIRQRFNDVLSDKYNRSEIYIRSTDSTRAKMTVLTAMAAVYPAVGDTWSKNINWVPVPYTTVPARYDYNLAVLNCPTYLLSFASKMTTTDSRMDPFADVLNKVSEILDYNITGSAYKTYAVHDLLQSEVKLGLNIGNDLISLLPELVKAAGVACDILFGGEDDIALQSGVLLNEFFTAASAVIAGNDTQRVRIYSAHDATVYPFTAVSRVTPRQGVPRYGSAMSLELRRVTATGQYVVLPVYKTSPFDPEIYLPVEGCGDSVLCDYFTFYDLTSKYLMDEDTWRTKCGYTDDLVVDDSAVA